MTTVTFPSAVDVVSTRSYDPSGGRTDRLTSVMPPGQSIITYTWDDNGNLTERGSDEFEGDFLWT